MALLNNNNKKPTVTLAQIEFEIQYKEFLDGKRVLDKFIIHGMARNNIDVTKLDVSHIVDFHNTFNGLKEFNQDISGWNVSSGKVFKYMFYECENFNQDISNWNVSNGINMECMFSKALKFNQPIGGYETTVIANGAIGVEEDCSEESLPEKFSVTYNKGWDTSNVYDMSYMFNDAISFNQNINNWDVSKVENMGWMFQKAKSFNQPLDNWDTSNARYMISMFDQAESFNQNLNNWNVSKVINFRSMFSGAHSFNQPIGGGLTTGISNDNIKNVFIEIKTGWDISYAKHMSNMFDNAKSFKQYLGDWEFSPNSERSERPDINKLSFDKHNIKYRYSEETLLNIFNNYKNLSDEDKYKSSIYIKNFKEWNSGKFNKICENLKIDQNIDHNI